MKKKVLLLCAAAIMAMAGCRDKDGDSSPAAPIEDHNEEKTETYERDASPGQILTLTLDEMRQMIDEDQTFAVVFTKEDCPYCLEFKMILESYIQDHNVTIYEVNLSGESEIDNDNKMIVQTYFPEFNTVPGVFSVKDGEEESYLNLYQLGISREVLDQWVCEYRLDAAPDPDAE